MKILYHLIDSDANETCDNITQSTVVVIHRLDSKMSLNVQVTVV